MLTNTGHFTSGNFYYYLLYMRLTGSAISIFLILAAEKPDFDTVEVKTAIPAEKGSCAQLTAIFRGM